MGLFAQYVKDDEYLVSGGLNWNKACNSTASILVWLVEILQLSVINPYWTSLSLLYGVSSIAIHNINIHFGRVMIIPYQFSPSHLLKLTVQILVHPFNKESFHLLHIIHCKAFFAKVFSSLRSSFMRPVSLLYRKFEQPPHPQTYP